MNREMWMEQRGNILVVDDEIGPRESMRMIMNSFHRTVTAENGREALQLISEESFDLVTLDLNMPDMNGIEVLQRIKEEQEDVEVVIVTGYGALASAQQAIRYGAFDYITKPYDISEMVSVANKAVSKKRLHENMRQKMADLDCRSDLAQIQDAFSLYQDIGLMDFIEVLSRTLEEKNPAMYQHSERVNQYCMVIAEAMNLPERDQENLRIASHLHDIGKVGISNQILNKGGSLTDAEWVEMREHPCRGVELVKPLCLPREVLSIIFHHHESFDGSGYPGGLKGKEVPVGARIIRIIDSYDAMTSNRPYRKAQSFDWVIEELLHCSGSQFDPEIVEVFVNILTQQECCVSRTRPD